MDTSAEAKDLVGQMLRKDYMNRPPASELLEHPFFKTERKQNISKQIFSKLKSFKVNPLCLHNSLKDSLEIRKECAAVLSE
jgi:serine/threonine protein kinase